MRYVVTASCLTQITFLRRYHVGIDVPSRLLAHEVLDDEQTTIRQCSAGEDLVVCTIAIIDVGSEYILACAGGPRRSDLCA